jgi:hypothetical protein
MLAYNEQFKNLNIWLNEIFLLSTYMENTHNGEKRRKTEGGEKTKIDDWKNSSGPLRTYSLFSSQGLRIRLHGLLNFINGAVGLHDCTVLSSNYNKPNSVQSTHLDM